jgi:hypothetical protein
LLTHGSIFNYNSAEGYYFLKILPGIIMKITEAESKSEVNTDTPRSSTSRIFSSFMTEVRTNPRIVANIIGNAIGTLTNITILMAGAVDILAGLDGAGADEFVEDMSLPGFIFGLTIALLVTPCSVYAHYILNTNSTYANRDRQYLLTPDSNDSIIDPRIALTREQSALLWLDYISHAGDYAITGLYVCYLASKDPTMTEKIFAQVLSTLGGMYAGLSDFDTCRHNMRIHNKNVLIDEEKPQEITPAMQLDFYAEVFRKLQIKYANDAKASEAFINMERQSHELSRHLRGRGIHRRANIDEVRSATGEDETQYRLLETNEQQEDRCTSILKLY